MRNEPPHHMNLTHSPRGAQPSMAHVGLLTMPSHFNGTTPGRLHVYRADRRCSPGSIQMFMVSLKLTDLGKWLMTPACDGFERERFRRLATGFEQPDTTRITTVSGISHMQICTAMTGSHFRRTLRVEKYCTTMSTGIWRQIRLTDSGSLDGSAPSRTAAYLRIQGLLATRSSPTE